MEMNEWELVIQLERDPIPVPCNRTTYKLRVEQVNYRSCSVSPSGNDENKLLRGIYVYYSTLDVTTYVNAKMMSFNTFISTVGGNLGLFVGFSCSSVFFGIIDWVAKRASYKK
jgi:hypothetical protein